MSNEAIVFFPRTIYLTHSKYHPYNTDLHTATFCQQGDENIHLTINLQLLSAAKQICWNYPSLFQNRVDMIKYFFLLCLICSPPHFICSRCTYNTLDSEAKAELICQHHRGY